jgi:cellulose synthase/poly-beta-1,6-N-acetylglucosamine synthase-like glycosyltransferase
VTLQVSVVVPTYRRPALLERCLAALTAQDLDRRSYEIIVGDDANSDETRRQVLRWAAQTGAAPAVTYVPVEGTAHGPAVARNCGWRHATGEIVAFTDDDCIPTPGWLRAGLAVFTRCRNGTMGEAVAGAWGRVTVPLPAVPTDYERNAAGLEDGEAVTANCFYRRTVLEAVGGFDERFTMAWREDSDMLFTLLERGARVVPVPEAVVVHPVRPAPWGVSLQQQRKSLFNALLYKKHPTLYRQRIQPAPPWRYYRIIGALLVALGAGLAGQRRPAALAGLAWAAMTAQFCLQRLVGASHAPRHLAEMVVTSALIPPQAVFWRLRGALRYRVFFL